MTSYDLSALYEQYPTIIDMMNVDFTSHEFILRLAQQNQVAYIDALYHYRHSLHRGVPTPFRVLHGLLARKLGDHTDLIAHEGEVMSKNIFGDSAQCAEWRKVN